MPQRHTLSASVRATSAAARCSAAAWCSTPPSPATRRRHALKLEAAGNHFVVWFDGTKVLDATDAFLYDSGKLPPAPKR